MVSRRQAPCQAAIQAADPTPSRSKGRRCWLQPNGSLTASWPPLSLRKCIACPSLPTHPVHIPPKLASRLLAGCRLHWSAVLLNEGLDVRRASACQTLQADGQAGRLRRVGSGSAGNADGQVPPSEASQAAQRQACCCLAGKAGHWHLVVLAGSGPSGAGGARDAAVAAGAGGHAGLCGVGAGCSAAQLCRQVHTPHEGQSEASPWLEGGPAQLVRLTSASGSSRRPTLGCGAYFYVRLCLHARF